MTGAATGEAARREDVRAAQAGALPVIVGSGITASNLTEFVPHCQGVIVGSWLKVGGHWRAP